MEIQEAIFEKVYDAYSDTIFRIAFLYLRNYADAQEVLQEVFIKYLKHEEFLDHELEKKWLIRVTINLCKDRFRNFWRRNTQEISQNIKSEVSSYAWVQDYVLRLPEKDRIVLHLFYYMGYPVKEIAVLLKIRESAVKQRLKRARDKLKLDMEEIK